MAVRTILLAATINIFLTSLEHLPISIATALYNTAPILRYFTESLFYNVRPRSPRNLWTRSYSFSRSPVFLE